MSLCIRADRKVTQWDRRKGGAVWHISQNAKVKRKYNCEIEYQYGYESRFQETIKYINYLYNLLLYFKKGL